MKSASVKMLKQAKLKVTPARVAVLGVFSKDCRPVNVEYIVGKLKKIKVDSVTVYRTIASLEKADLIRIVDLRQGSTYYELATHHHHHLVCTNCGVLEKLEHCGAELVVARALKQSKKFSEVTSHSFELFGVCGSCAKK